MPAASRPRTRSILFWTILCLAGLISQGCAASGSITAVGVETGARLEGDFSQVAYYSNDPNTADVFMTDLDRASLDPATDLARVAGQIVHIHLFLTPSAGRTPIEPTATNATIRHIVLAGDGSVPAVGAYEGAGFLLPAFRGPGAALFRASSRDASLALLNATPGFPDLVGPSETSLSFAASRESATARRIERRMREALALTKPVERAAITPFENEPANIETIGPDQVELTTDDEAAARNP